MLTCIGIVLGFLVWIMRPRSKWPMSADERALRFKGEAWRSRDKVVGPVQTKGGGSSYWAEVRARTRNRMQTNNGGGRRSGIKFKNAGR